MVKNCRFCGAALRHVFVDLGLSPVANNFTAASDLDTPQTFYPLTAYVCGDCLLVQIEDQQRPENIFNDSYAYFSSYSGTWVEHARRFAERVTRRFDLDRSSRVIEVASNDGYLLQHFVTAGIPVLGIEPSANTAASAEARGVPTLVRFFGRALASELLAEGTRADLVVANNVLAHVPDLNDFVAGLKTVLAPHGVISVEFPHLLNLIRLNQFDTIYHEHYSYFSLAAVTRIFARYGLRVFDVEALPTHGGSLRILAQHVEGPHPLAAGVDQMLDQEREAGLFEIETYLQYPDKVDATKRALLRFLCRAKEDGKRIAGYGAPAKGNTLLNYCGVGRDFLDFTVDVSPHKQGRWLPGTRIPIFAPSKLRETKPDYVLILPWNLKDEITREHAYVHEWGGRFIVPIPTVEVVG